MPWAGDWLLGVEKPRRAGPDEASPPGRDEEPDIAERMAEDYVVVDTPRYRLMQPDRDETTPGENTTLKCAVGGLQQNYNFCIRRVLVECVVVRHR